MQRLQIEPETDGNHLTIQIGKLRSVITQKLATMPITIFFVGNSLSYLEPLTKPIRALDLQGLKA